jgi:outer membrane protein assembly factor BamB
MSRSPVTVEIPVFGIENEGERVQIFVLTSKRHRRESKAHARPTPVYMYGPAIVEERTSAEGGITQTLHDLDGPQIWEWLQRSVQGSPAWSGPRRNVQEESVSDLFPMPGGSS